MNLTTVSVIPGNQGVLYFSRIPFGICDRNALALEKQIWAIGVQIFCDESGGFDGVKHGLVVSAVQLSPHDASRLMKKFRKATKLDGEIKGGLLTDDHRRLFFEMLGDIEHLAAAAFCLRTNALGAWASTSLAEYVIYGQMIEEACALIDQPHKASGIFVDGGRYSRQIYDRMTASLSKFLEERTTQVSISFVRSEITPGVQVADIISNTVYRAVRAGLNDLSEHPACGALFAAGKLQIAASRLEAVRPSWLIID